MKPLIQILTILFCFNQYCHAQFTVSGRIADEHDNGIPFANVLLLNQTDSILIKGAVADEVGNYEIRNISKGNYIVQSYMVGFAKSYSTPIQLSSERQAKLKDIILRESTKELEEVVIRAEKPLYEMEVGKMIVNVSSSVTSAGQTVIDVLEKSPGMLVNRQNNTFSLNGKDGVIVLMNGKRNRLPMSAVYQLLEGLNAADIEKIEIMSIPPAKYDADGDAGFINIVTKQGSGMGTTGSFMVNTGYGSGPRAGGSLNISHISKKLSIYGNYSYNYIGMNQLFGNYRETTSNGQMNISDTESDRDATRRSQNFQLGIDYYLGERTVIGALVSGYDNVWEMTSLANTQLSYSAAPDSMVLLDTREKNHWKHLMGNVNLQHTFKQGQLLNINFDYLTYHNSNPTGYIYNYFDDSEDLIKTTESRISKITPIGIIVGKIDYSFNLGKKIKWDSGVKGTLSDLSNDIIMEDLLEDDWIVNESFTNNSDLTEDILAAYTTINFKFNEFTTLNTGLRYEHTTTLLNTDEEQGVVNRKYGNFFPTFYFSRKMKENHFLQLSYGRRITRPTFNEMAPFIIFMDPYTFFAGNTNILPTLTNNAKVDYSYKNYLFSLQYSKDKNAIVRFQPMVDPESNVLTFVSDNIDRRETVSATITIPVEITDWWEMQNNFSGNWQMISTGTGDEFMQRSLYGWQMNSTQTFKLPKNLTLELSGMYRSPVINGYFNWLAMGFVNVGVQKTFKNDGVFRIACNDIFETTQLRWRNEYNGVYALDGRIKFEKRVFSISYTQPFGNKKSKGIRKRSVGSEAELRRVTN